MTREPNNSVWETNYNNKLTSGIEVKDKNGNLVNFITIKHDDVLDNKTPHRITISLNENSEPLLPPPETCGARHRHRRQLCDDLTSASCSPNGILTDGATTRDAPVARSAPLSRRVIPGGGRRSLPRSNIRSSSSRSKKKSSKKRAKPTLAEPQTPATIFEQATPPRLEESVTAPVITPAPSPAQPKIPPIKISALTPKKKASPIIDLQPDTFEPTPSTSNGPQQPKSYLTSMKDLNKNNPLFKSIDPKEVKLLLKSAAPGAQVVLPNGTVIRKSRRGGARAGAGRKRSRPLPPGQQSTPASMTPNPGDNQQRIEC